MAQIVPTPGAVLETVRPAAPLTPAPQVESPLVVPAAPDLRNQDPNAPRMQIDRFCVTGSIAIPAAELHGLIAHQAGKQYNLYDLQKVTRVITDYYRAKGYPVARAVIPAQKLEAGELIIEVIEGRVESSRFNGNQRYSDGFLQRWAQPLKDNAVRIEPLEERLLNINDLPGLTARAVLVPGTEYGATIVQMKVKEKPVDGQLSVNNSGRKEVGEYRLDGSVNLNNPLRIGDQLGVRTSWSEQGLVKMLGLVYSVPLNVQGTRLAANYTAVNYGIGGALADLDIRGKSKLAGLTAIHPFLRKPNENLIGTFGIRYFKGNQTTSGIPISDSSIQVAEAGAAWNRVDADFNVTSAGLRVSTNYHSKLDGERDSTQRYKIDGEASHLQRLGNAWDLKVAGAAQLSSAQLADAEKFSLGGPRSVRGYAAADVRGDRGVFGSAELRYRPGFIAAPSWFSLFYDTGYTVRRAGRGVIPGSETISSAGLGFSIHPTKAIAIDIAGAVPLTKPDPSDGRTGGRVWLNLTTSF